MGCISHPKVLSSWVLVFWPYHEKWDEVLSNGLWSLHIWTSADVSATHHHVFACLLMSRRPALTMLWILMLCISLFQLIPDASPPLFYMDILNLPTINFVTSVYFSKAPSSPTLIRLHGWCSFFGIFIMNCTMLKRAYLDAVGHTHIILVFSQTTVSLEVNPQMEVTL